MVESTKSDQLQGEDVGDRGACNASHMSMLVNRMDVRVIFPNKK